MRDLHPLVGLLAPLVGGAVAGVIAALLLGCGSWFARTVEGGVVATVGILAAVAVAEFGQRRGWW